MTLSTPARRHEWRLPRACASSGRPGAHRSSRRRTRSKTPQRAGDFATFTQLARQAVLSELSWEITVDAWIRSLPLQPAFKTDVLYPWISATIG